MIQKFSEAGRELKSIQGLCLDIDDTLSTEGKLTAPAYEALWALYEAGLIVVPITGRPAGWCDHIARFWPVHAVVGENGGFSFFMNQGVRQRLDTPGLDRENEEKLKALAQVILKEFPDARWASDQRYRECDLAIDFCEDVTPWEKPRIQRLVELCHEQGAQAKVSSIHVNAWFGRYDKSSGFDYWVHQGMPGAPKKLQDQGLKNENWIFIGDSPNDEPLFARFSQSVGVANLKEFLGQMKSKPRWITKGRSGEGFCEFARHLLNNS